MYSLQFFDIEDDSNGLVEAAVVDNEDWKPGTPETDKLASTRRGTRRGTAAAASRGRAGGGDSEGSAGAAATSAASSLTAFLISKPGEMPSSSVVHQLLLIFQQRITTQRHRHVWDMLNPDHPDSTTEHI